MNFTYKISRNGQKVKRYETHSYRRFVKEARTINWQKEVFYVSLRVSYRYWIIGRKRVEPFNLGQYTNNREFWNALVCFKESEE